MWDSLQLAAWWDDMGTGVTWLVTGTLMLAGLIGCVLPVLPGHMIILIGAIAHRLILGENQSGLAWWSFVVLGLLMAISQTFEMVSGAAGAKWFGGTRWGIMGALAGSVVGLFFMPFGLLLGPLIGAFACEMLFAKKETKHAVVSGVGSVVGTLAGMAFNLVIGIAMVTWFFLDVFLVGK